ncbi:clathrin coat assembly protein [Strigomonas culicis]|uniref:Clathrin coat assembly protein n=1 Tax=Strigomonas culicis TaxID=28005 RepID=S9UIF0_9TRYP|nr:clathrin coat assembly protein [Strigomonas culicis]EPY28723.1 clathrin coat assembly protein [Strigomonas culicis]|eukprot:EPY22626.1 clathrin coat assembly protein [Strigomonas culicis]
MFSSTFQSAGYFREKAIIGVGRLSGDSLSTAIVKTTSHKLKAPKEKYMQYLLAASYGHCKKLEKNGRPICEYIVRELEKRSHSYNWIIVLKTMVVLHRLLSDASDEMVRTICIYRNVFRFNNIKELRTSTEGARQSAFIAQYMTYLNDRCSMQMLLTECRRIETAEFVDYLASFNVNTLHPIFTTLLDGLRSVGRIRYGDIVVTNFCTYEAYQRIVHDGKTLFQLLSNRVVFVLNGFESLSLPQKKMWLQQIVLYDTASRELKTLFDAMLNSSHVFTESVPHLKPLPADLLSHLKDNVELNDVQAETCTLASLGIKSEDPRKNTAESLPVDNSVMKSTTAKRADVVAKRQTQEEKPQPKPTFTMEDLFDATPANEAPQQALLDQQAVAFAQFHDAFNEDDSNATANMWGVSSPNTWQSGSPAWPNSTPPNQPGGAALDWGTGIPTQWDQDTNQQWSAGAPQEAQHDPLWSQTPAQPKQSSQSQAQNQQQQQQEWGATGATQQWNAGTLPSNGTGQGYPNQNGPNGNQQSQAQNGQPPVNSYPPTQSTRSNKDPFKDLFSDSKQQYGTK